MGSAAAPGLTGRLDAALVRSPLPGPGNENGYSVACLLPHRAAPEPARSDMRNPASDVGSSYCPLTGTAPSRLSSQLPDTRGALRRHFKADAPSIVLRVLRRTDPARPRFRRAHDDEWLRRARPVGRRDTTYGIFRLDRIDASARHPCSLKVLLENLLRNEDGVSVTAEDVKRDEEGR